MEPADGPARTILNHLKGGGRCAVVVHEGVLFGSTGAHRELTRLLGDHRHLGSATAPLPGTSDPRQSPTEASGRGQ